MCDGGEGVGVLGAGQRTVPVNKESREPGTWVHLGVTGSCSLAEGILRLAGGKAEARLSSVLAVMFKPAPRLEIDKGYGRSGRVRRHLQGYPGL